MIKKWGLVAFGVALCSPAFADDDGGGCSIPQATFKFRISSRLS